MSRSSPFPGFVRGWIVFAALPKIFFTPGCYAAGGSHDLGALDAGGVHDASSLDTGPSDADSRDADVPDAFDPTHRVVVTSAWATLRSFTGLPLMFERSYPNVESYTHASMTDLHSIRRSFWEFPASMLQPTPGYVLASATLHLGVEQGGPDGVEADLAFYAADGMIQVDDFDRAGTTFATITASPNQSEEHEYDLTSIVADAIRNDGSLGILARLEGETPLPPGVAKSILFSSLTLELDYEPTP